MNYTINVTDILNTIPNCNFSKEAQIELLQIVRYITLIKEQPDNICEILEQKIQLLQHPDNTAEPAVAELVEATKDNIPCVKIRAVAILELLNTLNAGTAHNDRTKICKLIAFLTGNSYHRIYNETKKGITFTNYHTKDITEINKIPLARICNPCH